MAVRMATRSSCGRAEADSQLILNKDKQRPPACCRHGEAVYNDANGALEGNEVFQVVWLPEEEREQLLETVSRRTAQELPDAVVRRPLVFEGNTPAELDHNPLLSHLLEPAEEDSLSALRPSAERGWEKRSPSRSQLRQYFVHKRAITCLLSGRTTRSRWPCYLPHWSVWRYSSRWPSFLYWMAPLHISHMPAF